MSSSWLEDDEELARILAKVARQQKLLEGGLTQVLAEVRKRDERIAAVEAASAEQTTFLNELVKELRARTERLEKRPRTGKGKPLPKDWAAKPWTKQATPKSWWELVNWVDWLRETYDVKETRYVPACWPAHPELVNELAALRDAWVHAWRQSDSGENGAAVAHWHERFLTPFFARVSTYRSSSCKDDHHQLSRPHPRTRRDLVPADPLDDESSSQD